MIWLLSLTSFLVLLWWGLYLLVHRWPRKPIDERPDWGRCIDTFIPAADGGYLEVWRVIPEGSNKGTVVLAHGWSRNRGRMVRRARLFGELGYTTILHSARDHGASSRHPLMNAVRFGEDIEAVLEWVGEPVLLYGHSAGSAGAILAAHRHPKQVQALFLEASYADTETALMSLYRWVHPLFGRCCGPVIIATTKLLHGRNRLREFSPEVLAKDLDLPVMLIHGERDRRFPLDYARHLKAAFGNDFTRMFVSPTAGHSDSSLDPDYPPAVKAFVAELEARTV
ncbi:MAG: alpha/beta fold hydrolase [Desulfosarcinaceae bacterium]|nr:alpha/beta fold hydrolase [Desulfosarcinaceae bacterium]